MISANLRIVAIAGSLTLLIFIVELVRRRRLKEEYSVLWVLTATVLLLLALWEGLLRELAHFIGADSQASTLYFFGLLFVVFLLLHFSMRVSTLERRVIVLLQEIALLGERDREALSPREARDDRTSSPRHAGNHAAIERERETSLS
jgi:hypothetical protein